eukprot:1158862-Pelagomonas_calceolata.AAC.1
MSHRDGVLLPQSCLNFQGVCKDFTCEMCSHLMVKDKFSECFEQVLPMPRRTEEYFGNVPQQAMPWHQNNLQLSRSSFFTTTTSEAGYGAKDYHWSKVNGNVIRNILVEVVLCLLRQQDEFGQVHASHS